MASTTFEHGFTSGLKTLKEAVVYRWSNQARKDDMDKLRNIFDKGLATVWKNTEHQKAKGTVMILNTIIIGSLLLEACATAKDVLTPKAPVGGGDTGPRSADTNRAPIRPIMINDNFLGADEIKKSCEQKLQRECEIFGIAYTNEQGDPKISPFARDKDNNYFVWAGTGKFDRLTQKIDGDKIKWVNDANDIYFVGVPQAGSDTELETLYYIDPNGKVWELQDFRGRFGVASAVKPTQLPTEAPTSTPTLAPTLTPSWTPTRAPSLTPIPATIGATVVKSTPIPATATPRPVEGVPFSEGGINGLRSNVPLPGKEPRFPNNYRAMDCRVNLACNNTGLSFESLQSAEAYWRNQYPNAVFKYEYWLFDDGGVAKVFVGLVSTGK